MWKQMMTVGESGWRNLLYKESLNHLQCLTCLLHSCCAGEGRRSLYKATVVQHYNKDIAQHSKAKIPQNIDDN